MAHVPCLSVLKLDTQAFPTTEQHCVLNAALYSSFSGGKTRIRWVFTIFFHNRFCQETLSPSWGQISKDQVTGTLQWEWESPSEVKLLLFDFDGHLETCCYLLKLSACVCVYVCVKDREKGVGVGEKQRERLRLRERERVSCLDRRSSRRARSRLSLSLSFSITHSGAALWRTTQSWIIVLRAGLSRGSLALPTLLSLTGYWYMIGINISPPPWPLPSFWETERRRCFLIGRVLWINNQDRLTWSVSVCTEVCVR